MVEPKGFEPSTSSMPSRRAPNCATAPPRETIKENVAFRFQAGQFCVYSSRLVTLGLLSIGFALSLPAFSNSKECVRPSRFKVAIVTGSVRGRWPVSRVRYGYRQTSVLATEIRPARSPEAPEPLLQLRRVNSNGRESKVQTDGNDPDERRHAIRGACSGSDSKPRRRRWVESRLACPTSLGVRPSSQCVAFPIQESHGQPVSRAQRPFNRKVQYAVCNIDSVRRRRGNDDRIPGGKRYSGVTALECNCQTLRGIFTYVLDDNYGCRPGRILILADMQLRGLLHCAKSRVEPRIGNKRHAYQGKQRKRVDDQGPFLIFAHALGSAAGIITRLR